MSTSMGACRTGIVLCIFAVASALGACTGAGSVPVAGASNPLIVIDPVLGAAVYVVDSQGVIALVPG